MQRINPGSFTVEDRHAIPDVCAWPNITTLPDGALMVAIFNQPCHGQWEGDLDAWVSADQGATWTRRGCIAPREEPGSNRMNCAVGLTSGGDLVALVSGWYGRATTPRTPGKPFGQCQRVPASVYRSKDQGRTWVRGDDLPEDDGERVIPFGDIHPAGGSRLLASTYVPVQNRHYRCRTVISDDDGATWRLGAVIDPVGNETAIVPVGNQHWLAAARRGDQSCLQLLASDDDGQTWADRGPLTLPRQITGHLTGLPDGRILLTYGNRCINNMGVDARLSDDQGLTWSAPFRIADTPMADCGYPASAPLPDGRVVTAYYTQLPGEYQYEMRVAHWRPPQ